MRLQLYRLKNIALTSFVVDVVAVLETCMSESMLLILFFAGNCGSTPISSMTVNIP